MKNPNTRHGKLSDITEQTSIVLPASMLERLKQDAKAEDRSVSSLLTRMVKADFAKGRRCTCGFAEGVTQPA